MAAAPPHTLNLTRSLSPALPSPAEDTPPTSDAQERVGPADMGLTGSEPTGEGKVTQHWWPCRAAHHGQRAAVPSALPLKAPKGPLSP